MKLLFHLARVTFFVGRTHREKIRNNTDAIEAIAPKHQKIDFLSHVFKKASVSLHDDYRRLVVERDGRREGSEAPQKMKETKETRHLRSKFCRFSRNFTSNQLEISSDQLEISSDRLEILSDQLEIPSDQLEIPSDRLEIPSDLVWVSLKRRWNFDRKCRVSFVSFISRRASSTG